MGAFKLGKMTFGSLFKKPETILYPLETKPQPAGLKGHIEIEAEKCILCGMCDRSCSTDCISVDKKARTWEINRFGCVQCGYCVTVCPKKCLTMNPNYWAASTEITIDRVGIPEQAKPEKDVKASPKPAAEKPASGKDATPADGKLAGEGQDSGAQVAQVGKDAVVRDVQLQTLLSQMGEGKAEKVKAALSAK